MPKLIIESGADKGKSFTLSGDDVIGRLPANTIHINDDHSSRQHSNIIKAEDGYYISDMNSRNGTLVNEEKVSRLKLKEGDRITIGRTVFVYTEDEANVSIPSEQSEPKAQTMSPPSAPTMPVSPSSAKEISKAIAEAMPQSSPASPAVPAPATVSPTAQESVWRKVLLFFGLLVFFVALLLVSKWLGEKLVRYLASRHNNSETPANNR